MNEKHIKTVWITKYALTSGIIKTQAEIHDTGNFCSFSLAAGSSFKTYAHGNDWHLTEGAANIRAREMVVKKIASLEKSLKKLKNMDFFKIEDLT